MSLLHPDRLFPTDPYTRGIARELFAKVENAPIISPHGHTEPRWWGDNPEFDNPAALLVQPDHYVLRMLVSQGVSFAELGIGPAAETNPRKIWRTFAAHYSLFQGTPSRLWFDHALSSVFGIEKRLDEQTADDAFYTIAAALKTHACRPRALYDRFNIEVIATTDGALDDLSHHQKVRDSQWHGRVVPTYRPDAVTDPDFEGFGQNLETLESITGVSIATFKGYLDAHRARRAYFIEMGATASDHGHPSAHTADLSSADADALYQRVRSGAAHGQDAQLFRAQMLTEFARMSCEDGLVMQLHAGPHRNHNSDVFKTIGRDVGFDIPTRGGFVDELKPLLNAVGMDPRLTLILFTLDEATYSRELAPLAGAWPALRLGPPWWFHDSFEGIRRFRQMAAETAGFMNTVGFNDDTRALLSIPARHDVARRVDCGFLAELVTSHRLDEDEAHGLAPLLAHGLARQIYKL